jgi:hypothetical protein
MHLAEQLSPLAWPAPELHRQCLVSSCALQQLTIGFSA